MNVIATAKIDGPEAKGKAMIILNKGKRKLVSNEMWIAPGAPDVTIMLSQNTDGQIDDQGYELGMYDYGTGLFEFVIPDEVDLAVFNTVIVYCKQYTAHFGHGVILQ